MGEIQKARDAKSTLATMMLRGFKLIRMHGCEGIWRSRIEAARERAEEAKRDAEQRLSTHLLSPIICFHLPPFSHLLSFLAVEFLLTGLGRYRRRR